MDNLAGSVFPAGGKNKYSPGTLFSSHAPIRKSWDWLLSCLARGRCFVTARWRSWVPQRLKLENNQTRMYREFGSGTVITKGTLQCNLSLLGNFYSLMVFTKLCPPVLCFWEVKFSLVHLRANGLFHFKFGSLVVVFVLGEHIIILQESTFN